MVMTSFYRLAALALMMLAWPCLVVAAELGGVTLGADKSSLAALGAKPAAEEQREDQNIVRFSREGQPDLSVTWLTSTQSIVFIELDWAAGSVPAATGIRDFQFGATTLADIRTVLGSNGFGYKNVSVMQNDDGSLALLNCYDIAGETDHVIVFITVIATENATSELAPADVGEFAKLSSIIVSKKAYLSSLWGNETVSDDGNVSITLK